MGTDKARAESDGRALALRMADKAAAVCATVSLVGDPALYGDLGLPVLADNFPGQGPLSGIEAALSATVSEFNLIIACDMPGINENLLEALFALAGDCVLPRHDNGKIGAFVRRIPPQMPLDCPGCAGSRGPQGQRRPPAS